MTQNPHALELAGLWPPGELSVALPACTPDQDVLPLLCDAWRQASLQDTEKHIANRLERLRDSGGALTVGIPGNTQDAVTEWLGNRIAFWPDGVPKQRRIGLLSSHLGRELELRSVWFTALRAVCTKISAADDLLVTTPSLTADRFVRRCHELFGIRLLDVLLPKEGSSTLGQWGNSILEVDLGAGDPGVSHCVLSPEVPGTESVDSHKPLEPVADRAVIGICQSLIVLSLRQRGRLLPLIERRVRDKRWPVASVNLALGRDLVVKNVAEPLLDEGAVGWVLLDTLASNRDRESAPIKKGKTDSDDAASQHESNAPVIPIPQADRWSFLTHCTRRSEGPWPDQDEEEYLDDLILQRESADHSVLTALTRMLQQRRIVASSAAIRGATRVVSFTSVPLAELSRLRVFRSHRVRWDFEPYGICIARNWLESRGARTVIYGDELTWSALAEEDRPFFQLASTKSGDAAGIDWSEEKEWRHLGDVDLALVPADAALVLVRTEQEASALAKESPWPIVVPPTADSPTSS
jgi:hypothetical protein